MDAPRDGFDFDLSAAEEPSGAELCSFAPVEGSALVTLPSAGLSACAAPEDGGAELCCAAPLEVSALPDSGDLALSAASGEVPGVVGILLLLLPFEAAAGSDCWLLVSIANAGVS